MTNLLELKGISKTFPGVKALSDVDLDLRPGEVLGLCGENGAGKSTLMKVLTGIHKSDPGGEIWLQGRRSTFSRRSTHVTSACRSSTRNSTLFLT